MNQPAEPQTQLIAILDMPGEEEKVFGPFVDEDERTVWAAQLHPDALVILRTMQLPQHGLL